ncbi:hypothetical protein CK203_045152 [Vitis vinifera]|uniref:Uncharacterized protein n=1 Tax=Vitis vinifera TaxID=29760 RepID=A0A438HCZ6_VITVI|nr:hypothetical protein CK203_045152 [Vitis vinifera]
MLVPRTIPTCAAWTNDLMKKMVHAELQDYGDFGLADEIIAEYNAAERQIHQLLRIMRGAIDKLAKQQNTNKTSSSSHQSRSHNQPDINDSFPSPPHAYGSPLNDHSAHGEDNADPSTSQPAVQHSIEDEVRTNVIIPYQTGHPPVPSSSAAKQVLAYALDDTRDESQILCSMYDFFLTRFDFKCLGPNKLVDNKVNVMSTVIGIQERRPSVDMTKFEFDVPEVVQQLNPLMNDIDIEMTTAYCARGWAKPTYNIQNMSISYDPESFRHCIVNDETGCHADCIKHASDSFGLAGNTTYPY